MAGLRWKPTSSLALRRLANRDLLRIGANQDRGKAVAELVPIGKSAGTNATQAAKNMEAFMRSHRIRGVDIKALIEYGRP